MTKSKILLVDERTAYGFGTVALNCLSDSFSSLGFEPFLLDVLSPKAPDLLRAALNQRNDFAFALSFGRGITFKVEDRYIHEMFGMPHFVCFGDHPLYKTGFTDFKLPNVLYGFNDRSQVEFANSYFENGRYAFFPHFALTHTVGDLTEERYFSRDPSLFFSGSAAIMGRQWSVNLSSIDQVAVVHRMRADGLPVDQFIHDYLADDYSVLDAALLSLLASSHISAEARRFYTEKFPAVFADLDTAVRALRRRALIEVLAGTPLTVMGDGWDKAAYLPPSTTILASQPYLQCEGTRSRYQTSLNISQGQVFGPHDRVINASAAGQAVLTSRSSYFETDFPSGNLRFYSLGDGSVRGHYESLMRDDEARYDMAMKGMSYINSGNHSADSAAKLALTLLDEHGLLQ